ncbi:MAG: alpha/beta fold hydrolase [Gemmatimonadaceae bacterium]
MSSVAGCRAKARILVTPAANVLLGILAVLAPISNGLLAQLQDQSLFQRSIAAIARRQQIDDSVALTGARSILLKGEAPTPRAIVLLHGLTDSPRQFEALAYLLNGDGNNVYVPRLPQHGLRGGNASALGKLTAAQLTGAADSIVNEARGLGDSVVVIGLSMGGVVAAWIAQQRSVLRVVLIAPAIEPGRVPSLFDRPLVGLADRLPSMTRRGQPDASRPDREPGINTRAIAEILELGRTVLGESTRERPLTLDITTLVNASDRTVSNSAAEALARNWSSHGARVRVFEIPDSLRLPHNIIDPLQGRVGGEAVLGLLRDLAYGREPSSIVRDISPR